MIWSKYVLESGLVYCWTVGNSMFYLKLLEKEIQIAKEISDISENNQFRKIKASDFSNEKEWKSYIIDRSASVVLQPAMPDRPLVIKTEHDIYVLPGKSLTLYARIPVWVNFYSHSVLNENLLLQNSSIL